VHWVGTSVLSGAARVGHAGKVVESSEQFIVGMVALAIVDPKLDRIWPWTFDVNLNGRREPGSGARGHG
jgi:hypothetical protein